MINIGSNHKHAQGRGRIDFLSSKFLISQFSNNNVYCLLCADMKWIAHKLLKASCRWVFTFQGFIRDWQWKGTEETKVHSVLKTVSLLLPSYWGCLGIHLGRSMATLGATATMLLKTQWRSKPYPTVLVRTSTRKHCSGPGPPQWVSHHLHNLYNSDCNLFAPQMTMRYKVQ